MKYIIAIFIVALIALFIYVVTGIWKRVRKAIIGVRDGHLQNPIVSKIIKKAATTGKVEYTIFRPVTASMLFSFIYLFINYITNTYFLSIKFRAGDFLFTFLFMFVVWTIIGIIISHKIWNLCRPE